MWDEPIELIEHHTRSVPTSLINRIQELENYLDSVWKSRTLFYEEDPEQPAPARQPFLRFEFSEGKIKMRAGHYVGFIQFEGQTIQILPKLFSSGQADTAFRHLGWWLDYGHRVKFPFADLLTGSEPVANFPEALIRYFAQFTYQLIGSQPYHQYEELTETMSYVRGRLNTQAYITTSLSRGNWHQLVCDHEPFLFNNKLNQVIKYVTRRLVELCRQVETRQDLERILFVLDEVDEIPCTVQDCDTIQLNRFFQGYESCLDMCRFFLNHQYLNRQNAQQRHFCFLVPMDMVYEDFVAGVVKTEVGSQLETIRTQATGWLTDQQVFQIRNDLLITDKLGSHLVVDTKYKVRKYELGDRKAGVSQTDLYQMVSYALRRTTNRVLLLYPLPFGQQPTEPKTFHISSELMKENTIHIRAEDLTVTGETKQEMLSNLVAQLRDAFLPWPTAEVDSLSK
ncbi:hypothetical protein EXU85_19750 [Spirosoma sp. KCTC 42546]|uniref:McrC family protein n=1 Tax=Spirosoma sp. KCTC 42546 TaxID=2520506 RepID=UPI00115827C7|nr:hypothetical protein [Spirosoma sp. KCTC 42546]QDK80720.1 hypothetical protein EXU85_19750 [Spirosoma sp. KCTC 42546]